MSQVAVSVTPATAPVPSPTTAPARSARTGESGWRGLGRDLVASQLEGTPGRLRIAAVLAILACLVFALAGGAALRGWGGALADARADSAQLVRIQTVQNDLVKADATASNEYLAGTNADPQLQTTYDGAIAEAARLLTQPAATAEDTAILQDVVSALVTYNGLVQQARANNIQGLQVGAAYLRQAGDVLREQIVPGLQRVSQADQRRVADAYGRMDLYSALLVGAVVLALAALLAVQAWLSRRTRRIINAPLAIATLAVLVGATVSLIVLSGAAGTATRTAQGPYAATVALASARTAAFDAKAQESLGLIARGNAGSAEAIAVAQIGAARRDLATAVEKGASSRVRSQFEAWVTQHQAVRTADDGGDWSAATTAATGPSNAAFKAFDDTSTQALDFQSAAVDSALARPRTALVIVGWLVLGLGILAAVASLTGVGQRLGEYR